MMEDYKKRYEDLLEKVRQYLQEVTREIRDMEDLQKAFKELKEEIKE